MPSTDRLWFLFVQCFFRDPARILEWLNLLGLLGWAQFLLSAPDAFNRPAFSAFSGEPWLWAVAMVAVAGAQLVAMWPTFRFGPMTRFIAMAFAAAIWTTLALAFLQGEQISSGTRMYGAIAAVTALTGIYLGFESKPE